MHHASEGFAQSRMAHLCLTAFLLSTPAIIFQDQLSFFKMRYIPFSDLRTTWEIGIGVFSGSGISSKRSSVRASAIFSSFMANCCPMQFLTRKRNPLCYTQYNRRLVDMQNKVGWDLFFPTQLATS